MPRMVSIPAIPPGAPKAVAKADQEVRDLQQRLAAAWEQSNELARLHDAAVEADAQAHAVAIRSGADDPGDAHTLASEAAIARVDRELAALRLALTAAIGDRDAAIDRARAAWIESARKSVTASAERAAKATEELRDALGALADARATVGWLEAEASPDRPALGFKRSSLLTPDRRFSGEERPALELVDHIAAGIDRLLVPAVPVVAAPVVRHGRLESPSDVFATTAPLERG